MKMISKMTTAAAVVVATACLLACSKDDTTVDDEIPFLQQWQAGKVVSQETVDAFGGADYCFDLLEIPDDVWARMQGGSYKDNPYIARSDLRYIKALHWDLDGQIHTGEMVCNKRIAPDLFIILHKLYQAKYPIERMVLPDVYDADDEKQMQANNSSCFCYRAVAGSTTLSKHAQGLAVDLNTLYNPYVKVRDDGTTYIQPATATDYVDRTKTFNYKIDHNDLAYKLFTEAGFEWGGDWVTVKDYQHFELKDFNINVRFATIDQAQKLINNRSSYWTTMSQANIDWRLLTTGGSAATLQDRAVAGVKAFSDSEMEIVGDAIFNISQRLRQIDAALPFPFEVIFVKGDNSELWGDDAYTMGNEIYISQAALNKALAAASRQAFYSYVARQLFFVLARNSATFRRGMLALIGYRLLSEPVVLPASVSDMVYSNPCVNRFDNSAVVTLNGQQRDCLLLTRFTTTYQQAKASKEYPSPFYYMQEGYVPLDELTAFFPVYASNDLYEQAGRNTSEVGSPEEVLAVNFGDAVIYGKTGKKYASTDIIDRIIGYLTATW